MRKINSELENLKRRICSTTAELAQFFRELGKVPFLSQFPVFSSNWNWEAKTDTGMENGQKMWKKRGNGIYKNILKKLLPADK